MDDVPNDQKIQFYSAARAEVTQRIALRDQTLIAYIVAAGAYLSLVAPEQASATLTSENILREIGLAAIPSIISLVFTYVILQHHVMIGTLGEYLRSLFPQDYNIWENFYVLSRDKRYLLARTFSQALLLTVPIIYTGTFMFRAIPVACGNKGPTVALVSIFTFDVFVIGLIVRQHFWAYRERCRTDRVNAQSPNGLRMQPSATAPGINEKRRPLGRTLLGLAVFRACLGGLVLVAFRPQYPRLIIVCIAAFVLAEASDLVDGAIARRFSRPTLAGYLQDSIADKIFNFGCLFALAGRFQWVEFAAWGLLIREFLILAARITDSEIAISLKRFKRHVVLYAVFVRSGIFGFFVSSLNAGRVATILEFLSYAALAAAVVWGAINIIQMIFYRDPSPV